MGEEEQEERRRREGEEEDRDIDIVHTNMRKTQTSAVGEYQA